jgi:GMP synthase-like glutamine amidotransferase
MKPVVICRYAPHEGPGHFATYLERHRLAWQVVKVDEAEPLPKTDSISGLAMMGGPMSVNDELPWIAPMLDLVRECVDADVPVIGHCLGGQLMARALGADVKRNRVKEIGWGRVDVADISAAHAWGARGSFLSFHWHGETFAIPPGTQRIWSSAHCQNQAFTFGKHLAMQCHIEMTAEMIEDWCDSGAGEIARNLPRSPAVQTPQVIREMAATRLAELNAVADGVYERWTAGLKV